MADSNGFEGVKIESLFGSPGAALEKLIDRRREDDQFTRQLEERKSERDYTRQQQDRLYNLREIDSDTDPSKYKTGQEAIDGYTIGELKNIKDKALQNYINLDPAEMEYRLTQDMSGLIGWNSAIKDDYNKMQKGLMQFSKDNPNTDINKAGDFAMDELGKKYMTQTPDGKYGRLPTEQINHSTDPLAILNKPSVLGFLTNDVTPLQNYVQDQKLTPVHGSEYTSKKGFVKAHKYSGGISPFAEQVYDDDGKPTDARIKSEDFDLGGGKKLQMLPEDDYKTAMAIPKVRNSLLKLWEDEKQAKHIATLDPPTEERLFRDFARKQFQKYDISHINEDDKDIIPRPQVSINLGNQVQPFNDATSKVEFDRIGEQEPVHFPHTGVTISRGQVVDKNGDPYTTDEKHPLAIGTGHLTRQLKTLMKQQGMVVEGRGAPDYYFLKVRDGRIEAIRASGGADDSWVARQDVWNSQLQNNTEPIKSTQKVYGNQGEQQAPSKPTGKIDLSKFDKTHR